jgi:intein/homing endonuclease
MYFGNQKINKNINWHNEIQHRNYNFIGDFNQLILRTGIGFNLTEDNNNLLLGYGYINTEKYLANSNQKVNVNEHRIFQQFISKQNFGRFFVQHRYRVEERFLKNDFQLRLRYFLGINIPLNKKTLEKNTIYLSSYNEIFINSEKPLFDRNRLYGALGYFIHKNLKMEVGFMSQSLEDSNRNQFQIAIFNNFSI